MRTMNGCLFFAVALPAMVHTVDGGDAVLSRAEAADNVSQEIIAMQVRRRGFPCSRPMSADREVEHGKAKRGWILKCEEGTYHVHLVPRRAAHVERVK